MNVNYRKVGKIAWWSFASITGFITFLLLIIYFNLFGLFGKLPGLDVLENPKSDLASELYSADHVLLGKYYLNFNRSPVEYNELPPVLVEALIATEDVRFKEHSGVDIKGVVAIVPSLLMFKKRGSSTLSQQLAKNLFELRYSDDYQGAFSRNVFVQKIKEWFMAIRIERAYTKEEIMTMYLNTVEFGPNAHGIKSACKKFFNKVPKELKVEEAALLIGLLKGPSYYSPIRYPERAYNRRNTVLSQMVKYNYLSEEAYENIKKSKIYLTLTDEENEGLAVHFRQYLKPILLKWCKEHDRDLYRDGLKIYTTINSRMQGYAEYAVKAHMAGLQAEFDKQWKGKNPWVDNDFREIKGYPEKMYKRSESYRVLKERYDGNEDSIRLEMNTPVRTKLFSWKREIDTMISPLDSTRFMLHYLHTGFMSMDPKTGEIKAWVGDINGKFFKYDHVKQGKRQAGSTFKPILYSYALEVKGMTPETKVLDVPQTFPLANGRTWTPKNSNGVYSNEELTLKQALGRSVNTVSAYLMREVGVDSLRGYAKRLGIKSPLDSSITLCLGTSDVSVYEMVGAYSVFVNEGYYVQPHMIVRIEDKYGNVLEEFRPESKQVLSEQSAFYMTELLQGSVEETGGTSTALKNKYNIPGDVGGKTGTTQSSADGWFMGITPDLVSGCWVGGETKSIRFRGMAFGQGAKMALPIWALYMQRVYADPELGYNNFAKFKKPGEDPDPKRDPPPTDGPQLTDSPNDLPHDPDPDDTEGLPVDDFK